MANKTNRDKGQDVDESILDVTPPNINEPQDKDPQDSDDDTSGTATPAPEVKEENEKVDTPPDEETPAPPVPPVEKEDAGETSDERERRYKAQQSEAQIQAAKNRALIEKVEESSSLPEPTPEELKQFVLQDGVDWDELTVFEQATARRSFKAERSLALIREGTEQSKKIDAWAKQVDEFIDQTDSKPAYVKLSGHETEFRKYAMTDSHRGTPIDVLLSSFLFNLPEPKKVRGELLPRGGGGDKPADASKITDADQNATLRQTNPREWRRQIKAGKVSIEV